MCWKCCTYCYKTLSLDIFFFYIFYYITFLRLFSYYWNKMRKSSDWVQCSVQVSVHCLDFENSLLALFTVSPIRNKLFGKFSLLTSNPGNSGIPATWAAEQLWDGNRFPSCACLCPLLLSSQLTCMSSLHSSTDSTASIYVLRKGFSRLTQDVYYLPIEINDNGFPSMSSTNTLTIRVCSCDSKDSILSCNVEPYVLPAGLSTGALIAILACIVILLGKKPEKIPSWTMLDI